MNSNCDKLEAFFNGELHSADARAYEAHLVECAACRDAVEQQRWIDSLLCSPVRAEIEMVPPTLSRTLLHSIQNGRRQTRIAAYGLAAAAAVVVATGWILVHNRQARDMAEPSIAETTTAGIEPAPGSSLQVRASSEKPGAVFVGGPDVLVVPVESQRPNVTVVRLYPTYKSTIASNASAEHPSPSEMDWHNELNGG